VTVEPVQILNASWRDLNDLRHVERVCFEQDSWPLLDLIAVLTFPGIIRLKAVEGIRMVGFISGDLRPAEGIGWVTTLGVLPEYRRQGIARRLLVECESRINLAKVRLSVRRSNLSAIQLYSQAGYHQVEIWSHYYSGGEDALVLEKPLK
jgi:ribosomal protein S18 acetylase RimI-like enzyme